MSELSYPKMSITVETNTTLYKKYTPIKKGRGVQMYLYFIISYIEN